MSAPYTAWRKSSFTESSECVELGWRKSSVSGDTNCVELAWSAVRDSKNIGPILAFTPAGMAGFIAAAKSGELDLPR